ncbi:tRNA epoxyqueuosine(34) reductase QueG [Alloacidobacterium sp.]|uniref:tRNA epoxyqueuosine(34) reductase QueG n=1 Tax=Alloacidobacterium sp. TaxID=2951999 RepID=UPI002D46E7BB|nr:tRNA epoxyqueuosine(34) reductase QueG [Alloacidobacterium sp.]HYK36456.1 tRNA epoxyqueuosine(34) reductase QueG [Alloacidobacterium sp.]
MRDRQIDAVEVIDQHSDSKQEGDSPAAARRVIYIDISFSRHSTTISTASNFMQQDSLQTLVAQEAVKAGFSTAGIAAVPESDSTEDKNERRAFADWVEQGNAGEMEYLKRCNDAGELVRSSLRVAVPWAKSVVVCAANYNTQQPLSTDLAQEGAGWIARYAWSGRQIGDGGLAPSDYHKVLLKRLEQLNTALKDKLGTFESKCYVDTGPIVERAYARYAGLGWTGKNTCILNQKLGSWLFLGVILTSLEVPDDQRPQLAADRCGSCTRCIDACPTVALTSPRQMDATLCISYLTIEKRGPISLELREGIGRQVFGCDICQDVCPWNRKAPISADPELQARSELVNPALDWLAELNQESFGQMFFGSPIKRAKFDGLRRNIAIAMGNSRSRRFLPKLEEWRQGDDPVLAEAAGWAIRQVENEV